LIEREGTGAGAFLKTHRALQRSILHHLDRNITEREKIFKEALSMVRKAFPRENLARRGSPDDWPKQQKYLSHVVSVNAAVEQSDPPIANNLELAALLHDAAVFLYNWQGNHEARSLLRTAEKMCEELYLEMPDETRTLYAFCLAALGIHDQWGGIETRERSISRTKKALELQKTHVARFAPEDVSDNDWIALGRFHTDYGCSLLQAERFDEATALYEETFTAYSHAGNEDTLTVRFGLVNCLLGAAAAGQKNQAGEALWNKGLGLILKVLHADSFTSLWFRNLAGVSFFSLDLLDTSQRYHAEVLQTRVRILGVDHHETLSSKYCVAVGHQHSGDLDTAEYASSSLSSHHIIEYC
jgi:tetratricopeptide (TPR) repeat protein